MENFKLIDENWVDKQIIICQNEYASAGTKIMHDREKLKQYWLDMLAVYTLIKQQLKPLK